MPDAGTNERVAPEPGENSHRAPGVWRRWDVLSASLALNLLALALPMSILQVYDRVIPNQADSTFQVLLIALVVVALAEFGLRIIRSMLMSWEAARFDHTEGLNAIDTILHADTLAVEAKSKGFFLDRISALDRIQEFYSGQSMLLVMDFPFVIVFLVMIYVIAPSLIFVPVVLLCLFLLVSVYAGSKLHKAEQRKGVIEERRHDFLIEILQGIHTVKSMAMEAPMMRRYEELQHQSADSVYRLACINSIVVGIGASFSQLAVVAVVCFGASHVIAGDLSIGALAAATMLSGRVLQPGIRAMGVWSQFQSVRLAHAKARELFQIPFEHSGNEAVTGALKGFLDVRNISFRYPTSDRLLLDGASFQLRSGESVVITGRNGAGKSTLLRLLSGFLQPDKGEIFLDGRNLRSYKMADLRAEIALMPQHGTLFEGTILENMTLYREGEAVVQAMELSQILGLDAFVSKLPQGLDTPIAGASMNNLPEGMMQKIVMIRAMIGHPHLMYFDDANANLDVKNDTLLLEFIKRIKGQRTIVMVTHRPSYARICDRHLRLVDGKLVAVERESRAFPFPAGKPHLVPEVA